MRYKVQKVVVLAMDCGIGELLGFLLSEVVEGLGVDEIPNPGPDIIPIIKDHHLVKVRQYFLQSLAMLVDVTIVFSPREDPILCNA